MSQKHAGKGTLPKSSKRSVRTGSRTLEKESKSRTLRLAGNGRDETIAFPLRLTGLNEYISAERTNRFKAAKIKRETQDALNLYIRHEINAGRLHRHEKPCELEIVWTEENNKRDADNIEFATKFIQDALVEMGVFPDDNRKYITGHKHTVITGNSYSVEVTIKEKK